MDNKFTREAVELAQSIAAELGAKVRFSGTADGVSYVVFSVGSSEKPVALPRSANGVAEFERKLRAAFPKLQKENDRNDRLRRKLTALNRP